MITEDFINRFWEKVNIGKDDECWPWVGSNDGRGYGQIKTPFNGPDGKRLRRNEKAPRISLMIKHGTLSGMSDNTLQACHKCDNPICVNPHHLFWGTCKENLLDSINKGRRDHIVGLSGEKNGRSKISDFQRSEILALIAEGELNNKEIAEMYPIGHSRVSKLRSSYNKQLA